MSSKHIAPPQVAFQWHWTKAHFLLGDLPRHSIRAFLPPVDVLGLQFNNGKRKLINQASYSDSPAHRIGGHSLSIVVCEIFFGPILWHV